MRLAFLDTETTSLRPDRRAWEIGVIIRRPDQPDHEQSWMIDVSDLDLGNADPRALDVGRFYERHPQFNDSGDPFSRDVVYESLAMEQVEKLLRGAYIVGAVPNFDTEVLDTRMRANDILPSWHYHLCDVENLAAGALRQPQPWGFDDLLTAFGLSFPEGDRHTALGDAKMARALYDAVMAGPPGESP